MATDRLETNITTVRNSGFWRAPKNADRRPTLRVPFKETVNRRSWRKGVVIWDNKSSRYVLEPVNTSLERLGSTTQVIWVDGDSITTSRRGESGRKLIDMFSR
jgi:hypothetical protein